MFTIVALEGCPYSMQSDDTLKTLSIPHKTIWVNSNTKQKYQRAEYSTFPQITFKEAGGHQIWVGGNDQLQALRNLAMKLGPQVKCKSLFNSQVVEKLKDMGYEKADIYFPLIALIQAQTL
jgi:glutaredoxin